ncbi:MULTISPECIES: hypothetical protein [unclassified Streptomyces]|uniref:hypothetical protein n=1 Tax=unclassified Streptomyces TaxID=2593676 RepID=UPI003332E821
MHAIMQILHDHREWFGGLATTLVSAGIGWWLSETTRARADRGQEKTELRRQADELITAAYALRGAAEATRVLWEGRFERFRIIGVTIAAGAPGFLRAVEDRESRYSGMAEGLSRAARVAAQFQIAGKAHAATISEPMARLTRAAAPLLRHPDRQLSDATSAVLMAAHRQNAGELDTAFTAFNRALTPVLVGSPRWRRLLRRSASAPQTAPNAS